MLARFVGAGLLWVGCTGWAQAPPPAQTPAEGAKPAETAKPASKGFTCPIQRGATTDADAALSREQYDQALDLFSKMASTDPAESRAGTIRTLLAQNRVADARGLAEAWVAEQPAKAAAVETMAEVLFRAGELPAAYRTNQKAFVLDPCRARIYLLDGEFEDLSGYFRMSRLHFEQAHRLLPNDPQIREAWIDTLPRKKRLEEQAALLKDETLTNERDRARIADYLQHADDYKKDDCTLATPIEHAKIAIQPILDGPSRVEALALDVKFNDKRRRLEIDTGASGLLLSRGAASGLNLTRERQIKSYGIGDKGEVSTSVAHVESVKIGNLEFRNCVVRILEKRSALDIDGLIGGNVFAKFLLSLDYPKNELRLDPLPRRPDEKKPAEGLETKAQKPAEPGVESSDNEEEQWHDRYVAPEMKDWTGIYRSGHDLLIPVGIVAGAKLVSSDVKERLFIVDTGAGLMSVSPEAARAVTKVHNDSDMHVRGISGEVDKVYGTGKFTYFFANLKQDVDSMTAMDTTKFSHDAGVEISGFLGAPVLDRLVVHIDYRDNLMKFDYYGRH